MITLYGIKNCDTVKKARAWLDAEGMPYRFHDFRVDGLSQATLAGWVGELGVETLLNRRGTTWRKIPDADKENLDEASAQALMLEQPALIKRPVFDLGDRRLVGFGSAEMDELLKQR